MTAQGLPSVDLRVLASELAVCRLPPGTPVGDPGAGELWALTRTAGETSVVCAPAAAPEGAEVELGWMAFVVAGPLDFSLTGILAAIAAPLAAAAVPIFAVSTYDTDYVLVKRAHDDRARTALTRAGHRLIEG